MPHTSSQIFQTNNPSRWQRLKWGTRILVFIFIIAIVIITIALRSVGSSESKIPLETRAIKKVLSVDANLPAFRESETGKKYRGFRKYINNQWAVGKGCGQKDSNLNLSASHFFSDSLGIRAAFFMPWDLQSFLSCFAFSNGWKVCIY